MRRLAILLLVSKCCVSVCGGRRGGSDGKLCLVAQGIYKGLRNHRAFLLALPLCNFAASPPAISLSFKFEASILIATMTGLKKASSKPNKLEKRKQVFSLFVH